MARLWLSALAVAGLGDWILFDAAPGVNWGLWALAVAGATELARRTSRAGSPPVTGLDLARAFVVTAAALAASAAATTDGAFHVAIALAVAGLLAAATAIADDPRPDRLGLSMLLRAPAVAAGRAMAEAARRAGELTDRLGAERWRPAVRGTLLAGVVVAVLGSLLASADPILATFRDGVTEAIQALTSIPRLSFFAVLLVGALGAGGLAARPVPAAARPAPPPPARWSDVERLIALGAAAGLFAVFLALQASYLFGNPPALAGSGLSFAEYARRGFAELTVAATLTTLLVVGLERGRISGAREAAVRALELALVAELELLLLSAFRRVWLYEQAYGFTTARVYAQAYMIAMAAALALLALELARRLDGARLLRRAGALAAAAMVALALWNHEAWIVRRNLARHAETGRLDADYLAWHLSPNATPAIVAALPRAPAALGERLRERYAAARIEPCRWFEWSFPQRPAVDALAAAGISVGATAPGAAPRGCVRLAR